MKRFYLAAAAALLMGCASGCGEVPGEEIRAVSVSLPDVAEGLVYDAADNTWASADEKYAKLVEVMKNECSRSPDVKCTRILANDDDIIFIAGLNSSDISGEKVDAYTTYEIGSLTKMFTATCILQLCERGKLSPDDTIDRFFPEFGRGRDITVYDLLHMQAGLEREFLPEKSMMNEDGSDNIEVVQKYYSDGYTEDELLEGLFGSELICEPGTESNYSNAGYTLLAMMIEKVTGESYDEYVQRNIFDVCGMAHSSSMKLGDLTSVPTPPEDDPAPKEIFSSGYFEAPRTGRGAGDIHSCAADMIAFDRALIGGKLINEDSLAKMFDLRLDPDNPIASMYDAKMDYGCGWTLHPTYPVNIEVYNHTGRTTAYSSSNTWCKSEKYGNIYLLHLNSYVNDKTMDLTMHCDSNIIDCLKKN